MTHNTDSIFRDINHIVGQMIGGDRLLKQMSTLARSGQRPTYPPFNILQVDEHQYRIEMAVAGIPKESLCIDFVPGCLTVHYQPVHDEEGTESKMASQYLYRGISQRAFKHQFQLGEGVMVKKASLSNGYLEIDLERVIKDEDKLKRIDIN